MIKLNINKKTTTKKPDRKYSHITKEEMAKKIEMLELELSLTKNFNASLTSMINNWTIPWQPYTTPLVGGPDYGGSISTAGTACPTVWSAYNGTLTSNSTLPVSDSQPQASIDTKPCCAVQDAVSNNTVPATAEEIPRENQCVSTYETSQHGNLPTPV